MTDVDRQLLKAFHDAFTSWELDLSEAGYLIGVEETTARELLSAEAIDVCEEVVARIVMVTLIRTALDLCWSPSLSRQWMKLPNGADPYNGISPLQYVKGHGWPGLFWILRQARHGPSETSKRYSTCRPLRSNHRFVCCDVRSAMETCSMTTRIGTELVATKDLVLRIARPTQVPALGRLLGDKFVVDTDDAAVLQYETDWLKESAAPKSIDEEVRFLLSR